MTTTLLVAIGVLAFACAILAIKWAIARRDAKYNMEQWLAVCARHEDARARLRDVEPREAIFRKALGYYAHASTWAAPERHKRSAAAKDRGEIARGALEAGQ